MTLLIASTFGDAPDVMPDVDLLELRIDGESLEEVEKHLPKRLSSINIPTVVTCRSVAEGGVFDGDEEERIEMYQIALNASKPPRYIDIEYESLIKDPLILDKLELGSTDVILSWHNTKGRPKNLNQIAKAMQEIPNIAIVKIVWRARSLRDNLEVFELLKTKQQPMIAMCMGEYGLMSRVLAPKFGGFAVFVALSDDKATAPCQPTVQVLKTIYNFDHINKHTEVFGVIGSNVGNSLGMAFHNKAFLAGSKNAVYLPLAIPPEWEHLKATTLDLINNESLDFKGASVTLPHKVNMLELAIRKEKNCETIGATNTISISNERRIFATNTDSQAIQELIGKPKNILILGTGGVARAAIVAAINCGASVHLAGRNVEKAKAIAEEFGCNFAPTSMSTADAILNCTSVGMQGSEEPMGNPLKLLMPDVTLESHMLVFDTVYLPINTPLIQHAINAKCTIVTGDQLFDKQAALQQKHWYQ